MSFDLKELKRLSLNEVTISGALNYTLNQIMKSNEPDGIFNVLGALADASIAIALRHAQAAIEQAVTPQQVEAVSKDQIVEWSKPVAPNFEQALWAAVTRLERLDSTQVERFAAADGLRAILATVQKEETPKRCKDGVLGCKCQEPEQVDARQRPSKEWYAKMFQKIGDDDPGVIGAGCNAESPVPAQADAREVFLWRFKGSKGSWYELASDASPEEYTSIDSFETRTRYTRPADSVVVRNAEIAAAMTGFMKELYPDFQGEHSFSGLSAADFVGTLKLYIDRCRHDRYLEGLEAAAMPLDVNTILITAWQFFSKKESPFAGGGMIAQGGVGSLIEFAHAIRALKAEVSK